MPQSVAIMTRSGDTYFNARLTRSATVAADSTLGSDRSIAPIMNVLFGSDSSTAQSRCDWAVSMEIFEQQHCANSERNE